MKAFITSLSLLAIGYNAFAQNKPALDTAAYNSWPYVDAVYLSNNGKYATYSVKTGDYFGKGIETLKTVIVSTENGWKLELPASTDFTIGNRKLAFMHSNDSLCILTLGTESVQYIPHVQSYLLSDEREAAWLAYLMDDQPKHLVVQNLETGRQLGFDGVSSYSFSDDNRALILQTTSGEGKAGIESMDWIDLASGNKTNIYQGAGVGNIVRNANNTQLAFEVTTKSGGEDQNSIWYYKMGMDKAVMLADDQSSGIDKGLRLGNITAFSNDDNQIFFDLKKTDPPAKSDTSGPHLNIWSYMNGELPSNQIEQPDNTSSYKATIRISDHRIIRLLYSGEDSWYDASGDYILVNHHQSSGDPGESYWNKTSQITIYLESIRDGKRIPMPELKDGARFSISYGGKFLIWFDHRQNSFFSYEIATGTIRNITKSIHTTWWGDYMDDWPGGREFNRSGSPAGWLEGDKAVLLYDRYDLWEVDPTGEKPPVNLTNGYGQKHHTLFYLINQDGSSSTKIFAPGDRIILTAFNADNKNNGFYSKTLGEAGDPELLTMGPYLYDITDNPYVPDGSNFIPMKARDANVYIVRRESATESPNYFATCDFKTFTPLSDLHPEKDYNWYTSELHTWKSLDGKPLQGILFKPENFDPNKKYPVILFYYERRSDGLNAYIQPENLCNGCTINISSYVSNGYLVFEPDIHYTLGNPMQGTYNDVVSAAKYLSRLPFVDGERMGLQGCSWGGIQTDYLVTHTHLFAAACAASGESDFVSFYGSLDGGGGQSQQGMFETGQARMGATPWQIPEAYIKNSAIYSADKVTTPFLIMHTTKDGRCPFYDAVTFFNALRRLGKKAWMLEYTDGDHGVEGRSADDFSMRMMQFFDYYLKDKPAPEWMVKTIPVNTKEIETSLRLEPEGVAPGPNLLINSFNH